MTAKCCTADSALLCGGVACCTLRGVQHPTAPVVQRVAQHPSPCNTPTRYGAPNTNPTRTPGEALLYMPTADGTRVPLLRRGEIVCMVHDRPALDEPRFKTLHVRDDGVTVALIHRQRACRKCGTLFVVSGSERHPPKYSAVRCANCRRRRYRRSRT